MISFAWPASSCTNKIHDRVAVSGEANMKEVNTLRPKRCNKINNVNKNILGIVNEVVRERPTTESDVEASYFLDALNEQ